MKLEGYDVKRNDNITYRQANGKDKDIDGNIVPEQNFVFVKINDCEVLIDEFGKSYYNADKAPAIPITYIDHWYGFGEFKNRVAQEGIEIDNNIYYQYQQATMYFAHDGKVYTGSLQEPTTN